ncbi:MAG: DUF3987 domain-containing protein, partial [Actinomycetota bacterium]|nr:DUF3987 domain-containing protein [Actinomycetota bacterium]
DWALEIVAEVDTYTEVSPSGTGLKFWACGDIPHQSYSKKLEEGGKRGIEVYAGGRWFAVTGWHLEGTPRTINRRTTQLTKLVKRYFPNKFKPQEAPQAPRAPYVGGDEFDLENWLAEQGVPISGETSDNQGRKWKLSECPRAERHSTADASGAYVGQMHGDDGTVYGPIYARCSHAGCGGGDEDLWHDLRRAYQPGWEPYKVIKGNFGTRKREDGKRSGADVSDVSDVSSKQETFIHPGEFPVDALPEECANYVREAAESLLCPPELVGVPALCALSAVIGHSRALRIKPGWRVSGNLYAVVVDWPGSRKSPAAAFAYKPLYKLQAELRKDHREAKKDYEKEVRQHAVDKKLAAKDNKAEPEPPAKPTMKRCIVDDITVEALAGRLEENPRGLLSAQDELTGFIRGMDQYKSGGKGNTRQTYLKIWSNQPIIVDRKGGEEPVVIPNPYVTLQGSIQPGVLGEIADDRDDGFLDRWLTSYPESHQGGYSDSYVSDTAELAYVRTIEALWKKEPLEESEDGYEPRVIQMSEEAKEIFKAEANGLREEMYAPGFPEVMRGAWAKFDLHLARLALILAVARQAHEDQEEVGADDMRNALALLEYFKDSARKVYGQLFEANPDDVLAADLKTFLTKTGYVFSGTLSLLRDSLKSRAFPKSDKSAGRALRRIAKSTPGLSFTSRSDGKNRLIMLQLEKTSETSETSSGGSSYADLGADLGDV